MSSQVIHPAGSRGRYGGRPEPCQVCGNLDRTRLLDSSDEELSENNEDDDDYISLPRLELSQVDRSGKDGCDICSILMEIFQFFLSDEDSDLNYKHLQVRLPTRGRCPEVTIVCGGVARTVQIYTPSGFHPCWHRVPVLPVLFSDRQSPNALDFIKSCLRSCLDGHVTCKSPNPKLPTRVLDVGRGQDNQIRLVQSSTNIFEPYIALSYCWGHDGAMIKTEKRNRESFESGISILTLPIVFQECISLSRSLGIRYVWIDALCIIQDDREDWERESSMMSQTYAQAFLTIAASMSASTSEGFLRSLGGDMKNKEFSKKVHFDGNMSEVKARIIPEVGIHSRWTHWYYERHLYPRDPWSQRGWTLQEQLLSPRLLMFTSSEIQWSCQGGQKCECKSLLNHGRLFGGHSWTDIEENASNAFYFWHKAVEDYSIRALTHCTDRLPALSGIAQVIQEQTGSTYAAGLWGSNIAEDLLWERTGNLSLPTDYLAPSFSWASVVGEVDYQCFMNGIHLYQEICQVLSLNVDIQGHNPLGMVRDGEMTISGPLTPATLVGDGADGFYYARIANRSVEFPADTVLATFKEPFEDGLQELVACRSRLEMSRPTQVTDDIQITTQNIPEVGNSNCDNIHATCVADGARCWLLRLGFYLPPHSHPEQVHMFFVLGKHPIKSGKFERLGLLVMHDETGGLPLDNPFVFDQERLQSICIV